MKRPYRTVKWHMKKNGIYRRSYTAISKEDLNNWIKQIVLRDPGIGKLFVKLHTPSFLGLLEYPPKNIIKIIFVRK